MRARANMLRSGLRRTVVLAAAASVLVLGAGPAKSPAADKAKASPETLIQRIDVRRDASRPPEPLRLGPGSVGSLSGLSR